MSQAPQFLILTTAGWLNRQQEDAIEYLREENRVLREILGRKRIRFTDAQRKRLALRGKKLGRKVLEIIRGQSKTIDLGYPSPCRTGIHVAKDVAAGLREGRQDPRWREPSL